MRCEQVELLISKAADHELAVRDVGQLQEHLKGCAACQKISDEARDMRAWFVPSEPVPVPAGFAQRVTEMAFAGGAEGAHTLRPVPRRSGGYVDTFLPRMTAVAAALLAMLALALYTQRSNQSRDLHAEDGATRSVEDVLESLDELNKSEGLSTEDSSKNTSGDISGDISGGRQR